MLDKLRIIESRRVRFMPQSEAAECALACLGMVAGYHGQEIGLSELRRRFPVSMAGSTMSDMVVFAAKLGMSARALRLEVPQVRRLALPVILHWDLNHFVVLDKVATRKGFRIQDPASGPRWITREELSRRFTGIALELTPTADFSRRKQSDRIGLREFCSNMIGLKRALLVVLGLSVLLQAFIVAGPYYMQLVVDDVLMTGDMDILLVLAIGFSLILLLEVGTDALRSVLLLHLGSMLSVQMTVNLFHHMIRLPLAYFHKRHVGDIVSRFASLQYVKDLIAKGLVEALIDGVMLVVVVVILLVYSWKLALMVVVAACAYLLIRVLMYHSLRQASAQEIAARANENSNFIETVRGIQTLKLHGAEAKRQEGWQDLFVQATNWKLRLGLFSVTFRQANRIIFGAENILIVYVAAKMVMVGGFSVGMLFAFMAYKLQFMGKFSALVEKFIEFRMLSLHFERIGDVALTEREEMSSPAAIMPSRLEGRIALRDVSFRYGESENPAVSGLSLDVAPGEFVAIVGPSGCGKSTALKLMLGLLRANAGEILIDDIPLDQVGMENYRKQVAAVMQDDQLLSGTIAENIAFFDEQADLPRVLDCARAASIDRTVRSMPMGYNSLIGDMGSALSGGQKQRILLARALYRHPKILFLDEATSHLDVRTESSINEALCRMNMTRVVIAHRLETIQAADRVIDLGESMSVSKSAEVAGLAKAVA